jgi:CRP-like cAMP-binding protein
MKDQRFGIEDVLSFSLFQGLKDKVQPLEALMSVMKYEIFQSRTLIIDEKSSDDRIFLLLDGEVEVNKVQPSGKIVSLGRIDSKLRPFFGESALLRKPKRSSNVAAHCSCTCLSLRAKDFETFMVRFPEVGVQVYRNMASMMFDRLSKADSDLSIQLLCRS